MFFRYLWTIQIVQTMPRTAPETISIAEFARRVGCDESTVRAYIQSGKIAPKSTRKNAAGKVKLIPELATADFNAAREMTGHRFARSGFGAVGVNTNPAAEPAGQPKPKASPKGGKLNARESIQLDNLMKLQAASPAERLKLIAQHEADEYDLPPGPITAGYIREIKEGDGDPEKITVYSRIAPPMLMPRKLAEGRGYRTTPYTDEDEDPEPEEAPKPRRGRPAKAVSSDAPPEPARSVLDTDLESLTVPELTKREAILRVQEKELDLRKKTGEVVAVSEVHAALFVLGQNIRQRIEAIPSRIIGDVYAAKDLAEAELILEKEINEALIGLSGLGSAKLGSRK